MPSAAISCSTSGANDIIAAPGAGKYIRILALCIIADGTVTATLNDDAPTNYSGAEALVANSGFTLPGFEQGWFDCGVNQKFQITLGGAVGVRGIVRYEIRP